MSKCKLDRRFNKRARLQPVETKIDESEQKRLTRAFIESEGCKDVEYSSGGYDAANALILPAKKRKVKHKYGLQTDGNKLSKKEKKRLEKIVEIKDKKLNRQKIFESLALHRASEKAEAQFVSIANPDGGGVRGGSGDEAGESSSSSSSSVRTGVKINSIAGSNKKYKKLEPPSSSSSSSPSDDDDGDENKDSDDENKDSDDENEDDEKEETYDCKKLEDDDDTAGYDAERDPNGREEEAAREVTSATTTAEGNSTVVPVDRRPAKFVVVERDEAMAASRLKLPILEEEQNIVETINDNDVTIVSGETGSGKTTQVPQFLYEAGYCESGIIGVTEPRRVAAIAMATRVAREMNLQDTKAIAYQIRYEKTADSSTKIKFMTDGVLLKEIQSDFLLSAYRVIIIDEAHERSVYSDILIGLLSRVVPLRRKRGSPLKLIVMSATLRVEDFTSNARLFNVSPPRVHVEARQFPVTVHFNKKTPDDFVEEAFKKVSKIHRTLPEGGVLVFVTGRQEVHRLCAELRKAFPARDPGAKDAKRGKRPGKKSKSISDENSTSTSASALPPKIDLDNYLIIPEDEESALIGDGDSRGFNMKERGSAGVTDDDDDVDLMDDDDDDVRFDVNSSLPSPSTSPPLHVLPLYSLLSPERQRLVFAPPPEGHRLCVVATNVAETSLTIPGVRYVVDCGKVKMRVFDRVTGVSAFAVMWASQASANQRAGRAGRTAPGHCYRLYSSAVFNDEFPKFAPPEMTMRPVDDLFLHMKDLGIDKVINFPFPTPPSTEALRAAEKLLLSLGALKEDERLSQLSITARKKVEEEKFPPKLTKLGRLMALFPISPRYSKMLALGHQRGCLPYVIAIISALTVQEVLFQDGGRAEEMEGVATSSSKPLQALREKWAGVGNCRKLGDLMVLLKAVGAAEFDGCSEGFCRQFGLRHKAMLEIRKLRSQLTKTVNTLIMDEALLLTPKMVLPTDIQAKLLCQIVLSGCGDRVARKMANQKVDADSKHLKNAYEGTTMEDPLFIHPSSVLFRDLPEYVVFQESIETSKMYMKGVISIEPHWLPVFAEQHCRFEDPLDEPAPTYNDEKGLVYCHQASTFGPRGWLLPAISRPYPAGESRFRWFARFFLEGRVCPAIERFVPVLLSGPSVMNKSWANLQPRTNSIIRALASADADSKDKLKVAFEKNASFLKVEYLQWIPEALHAQVEVLWPPLTAL